MVDIQPPKVPTFPHCSPKTENPAIAPLPTSALALAPTGTGKSVLLSSLLTHKDLYRNCFSRIYIFSANMFADRVWDDVKSFSSRSLEEGGLGVDQNREQTFFTLDEKALVRVIQDQIKISEVMKRKAESGKLKMPLKGVAIVLDDVLDNPRFRRFSPMIDLLASRARHAFISFSRQPNISDPSPR